MADRFALPPVVTASSWSALERALWEKARRIDRDDDGMPAPVITNREAISIIAGVRALASGTQSGFPLWYQFAAAAYGWAPETDEIDTTTAQAEAVYSPDASAQLAQELHRIVAELDAAGVSKPRIQLEENEWTRMAEEVNIALRQDGARAEFKIPLPACKDPRTGKPAKPVYDPRTRKWTCPGGVVTIDDPLTAILKTAGPVLLIVAALYGAASFLGANARRGRRKTRR